MTTILVLLNLIVMDLQEKDKEAIRCYQIRAQAKKTNENPWHLMTLEENSLFTVASRDIFKIKSDTKR